MKATIVEEKNFDYFLNQAMQIEINYVLCSAVLLASVFFYVCIRKKNNEKTVFGIINNFPELSFEDAGESNHSRLLSVSISSALQFFDLSSLVKKIEAAGGIVLSTADTSNPSNRLLTVEIPKTSRSVSVKTIVLLGIVFAIGIFSWFHSEKLYNLL